MAFDETSRMTADMPTQASAAARTPRRIGIMGGTFDPPHNGHLACATAAEEALDLDEVLFVPCGVPSFKQDSVVASAADRLAMARLGVAGHPSFSVESLEVDRLGVTYTVDTLRELHERYPEAELVFIVGADAARTLPTWHRADELARIARFAVIARNGVGLSTEEQRRLADAGFAIAMVTDAQTGDVSSHEIRSLAKEGKSIAALVPERTARYIMERELYR